MWIPFGTDCSDFCLKICAKQDCVSQMHSYHFLRKSCILGKTCIKYTQILKNYTKDLGYYEVNIFN